MCGLSGVAGAIGIRDEKIFKNLLVVNSLRGQDSTGAASISREMTTGSRIMRIAKEVGPFPFLFDTKSFDKLFVGFSSCLIGHNRSRTVGEASRRNAHPFMFDNIVGAHNGTLDYTNKNRLEAGSQFKTDSEAIFNNIEVHGIEDTIGKIEASEAYALTWYDKRNHTINFCRNDKRTLFFAYANKGATLYWASEAELLWAVAKRETLEFDEKIHLLPVNRHFAFSIPPIDNQAFQPPVETPVKNYVYLTASRFWKGGDSSYNSKKNNDTASGYDESELWDDVYMGYGFPDRYGAGAKDSTSGEKKEEKTTAVVPFKGATEKIVTSTTDSAVTSKTETTELPGRKLDTKEVVKRVKWDHLVKHKKIEEGAIRAYKGSDRALYYNKITKKWLQYKFNPDRNEWDTFISDDIPYDIPYHILDINSRHEFKHSGKKKHKKIYYRAYDKALLEREPFELAMRRGCTCCMRTPEWGNKVVFVSPDHDFLCEYCAIVPGAVESLISINSKKVA